MLTIILRDGETRKLNVHPLFFTADDRSKETIADKVYALAQDFRGTIYKMSLMKDGIEVFAKENAAFNPAENVKLVVAKDTNSPAYKAKRELRNFWKRKPFTMNMLTGQPIVPLKLAA